jgi:hypothetical protein
MPKAELLDAKHMNKTDQAAETKLRWSKEAEKHLLGRTIVAVRYLTDAEVENLGWYSASVVLLLDNGAMIFPSQDDEGNNAGALFGQGKKGEEITLPVI